MAQHWLDLARYADTHGYHTDSHRDMWRWRQWVIESFAANMPFDQFTVEQIAGDLLPEASLEQKIASGFNRNHMVNFEAGAIPEEYRTEYVVDRTVTTSTIWLGQTMQCCRCHDHKYDPFTRRDFYRLFAYFNNVEELGLDGRKGNAAPFISAPTALQREDLASVRRRIQRLQAELQQRRLLAATDQQRWERRQRDAADRKRRPPAGAVAHFPLDERTGRRAVNRIDLRSPGEIVGDANWIEQGRFNGALLCGGKTNVRCAAGTGDFGSGDPFSISVWIYPTVAGRMSILSKVDRRPNSVEILRGWELRLEDR